MTNLQETATWESHITQIELGDDVEGGLDGIDNVPHRQLASRTAWLKAQIESIATACAGFAAKVHFHAIGDVTGLQTSLDSKATVGHNHGQGDVYGLSTALAGKSDTSHSHTLASLGAAAASHTHTGADITFVDGSATYRLSIVSGVLTQTRL